MTGGGTYLNRVDAMDVGKGGPDRIGIIGYTGGTENRGLIGWKGTEVQWVCSWVVVNRCWIDDPTTAASEQKYNYYQVVGWYCCHCIYRCYYYD